MGPKICIRKNRPRVGSLIPRDAAILETLQSIKTVKIIFKTTLNEEENQQRINEKQDRKVAKVKEGLFTSDNQVGWVHDAVRGQLLYCDNFDVNEINKINDLERQYRVQREVELRKKFGMKPCYVTLVRYDVYQCNVCQEKFKSSADLCLHRKTYHLGLRGHVSELDLEKNRRHSIEKGVLRKTRTKPGMLRCMSFPVTYKVGHRFERHVASNHKDVESEDDEDMFIPLPMKFRI